MRLKLLLAYNGAAYKGWQIQERPNPPPTIQGTLETALFQLAGSRIRVTGASRTDAGVHAIGQVAHCDVPEICKDWRHSLNALLPADLRVLSATPASPVFHAQQAAIAKVYYYDLWQESAFTPPNIAQTFWACGPLNLERINAWLPVLTGFHDFAAFRNAGSSTVTTGRQILSIAMRQMPPLPYFPAHLPALRLTIKGKGFLKQMARNIAGFLVDIGKGKLDWQDLPAILASGQRSALPSRTAPACGLTLAKVFYADES